MLYCLQVADLGRLQCPDMAQGEVQRMSQAGVHTYMCV